jgi:hypothetical protein
MGVYDAVNESHFRFVQFRIFDFELFPECGFVHSSNLKISNLKIGRLHESAFGEQFEIKNSKLDWLEFRQLIIVNKVSRLLGGECIKKTLERCGRGGQSRMTTPVCAFKGGLAAFS